jgi:hypothetical protein
VEALALHRVVRLKTLARGHSIRTRYLCPTDDSALSILSILEPAPFLEVKYLKAYHHFHELASLSLGKQDQLTFQISSNSEICHETLVIESQTPERLPQRLVDA